MKTFTDDEVGALLDALCELYAEKYPYPGSREEVAAQLKRMLRQGLLTIEIDPEGERLRLIPSVMNDAVGAA
jgi:hypothetical protein